MILEKRLSRPRNGRTEISAKTLIIFFSAAAEAIHLLLCMHTASPPCPSFNPFGVLHWCKFFPLKKFLPVRC